MGMAATRRAASFARISARHRKDHSQESGVGHDIKLSGGEITVLKALGLSGTPMAGKQLLARVTMADSEVIDTINGLISQGYVVSSKVNVQKIEDVQKAAFRVDGSSGRELRDAMRPGRRQEEDKPRRRRG